MLFERRKEKSPDNTEMAFKKSGTKKTIKKVFKEVGAAVAAGAAGAVGAAVVLTVIELFSTKDKNERKSVENRPCLNKATSNDDFIEEPQIAEENPEKKRDYNLTKQNYLVNGHKMKLANGKKHSDLKAKEAKENGVDLGPNETYRTGYIKNAT